MSGPDGLEERTAALEDRQSRIPDHDTRANEADHERDALWSTPVACVVRGHDDFGLFYCRRCGTARYASLAMMGDA